MTDCNGNPADRDLRSYGRKRGRKPSARQAALLAEALPRVAVDLGLLGAGAPRDLFPVTVGEVWLEIGFGGGEHMIQAAIENPDTGHIGCETFEDGVVKALAAIEEKGLRNVRIYPGDVRELLRRLPVASIGRVYVLFPDPWPKRRHAKRRLLRRPVLDLIARVLRPGGELRVATDIGDYAATVLEAARRHPDLVWSAQGPSDWRLPWPGWPGTRYEAKAIREGRRRYFLLFKRT